MTKARFPRLVAITLPVLAIEKEPTLPRFQVPRAPTLEGESIRRHAAWHQCLGRAPCSAQSSLANTNRWCGDHVVREQGNHAKSNRRQRRRASLWGTLRRLLDATPVKVVGARSSGGHVGAMLRSTISGPVSRRANPLILSRTCSLAERRSPTFGHPLPDGVGHAFSNPAGK